MRSHPSRSGCPAAPVTAAPRASGARKWRCSPVSRSPGTRGSSRGAGSTPRRTCSPRSAALRLDEAGLEHLLTLAQPTSAPVAAPQEAPTALVRLIRALQPAPAYVLGPHWEFLAWNEAQERLYPRVTELEGVRRNLLWVLFADPFTRDLIVDWDIHARQALAEFRAGTTARRNDPELIELVDALRAESAEFSAWWPEQNVAQFETRLRRFRHPAAGLLTFEYQLLAPVEWPGLRVACQLPVPGDDSAERLSVRHYLV